MKLTDKLSDLIRAAVSAAGVEDGPGPIMAHIEEELTARECDVAEAFVAWATGDWANRKFGSGNVRARFEEFKNSTEAPR